MKNIIFMLSSLFLSTAYAGQWSCNAGLDGKTIVEIFIKGDEQGVMADTAQVKTMGISQLTLSVEPISAEAGEMTRAIIGAEDPRSKMRFRLLQQPVAPGQHPVFIMLENFAIKQELDGICQFQIQ